MTTLFSKGIELEQNLRKGFESAQDQIKQELEARGLRLSATDLAALVEDYAPAASREALSGAFAWLKPFTGGIGLRVSKLSDRQIEIIIPARDRNLAEDHSLHEGVLLTAGLEAAKLLWMRHAPLGSFEIITKLMNFESHRRPKGDVRARLELVETAREHALSQLRQKREATSDLSVQFLDQDEQAVAQLSISFLLKHAPALDAPAD